MIQNRKFQRWPNFKILDYIKILRVSLIFKIEQKIGKKVMCHPVLINKNQVFNSHSDYQFFSCIDFH